MKAVILAGGKGSRLKPYTISFPKPLVPVGDEPIMETVVKQLATAGFDDIIVSVGHLAELVMNFFGDGSKYGVEITYAKENTPLGTAGPLAFIDGLNETFLLMNGDILTDIDFQALVRFHRDQNAQATVATVERKMAVDYGVVRIQGNNIIGWDEKPVMNYRVSSGIYVLEPDVLEFIPRGPRLDFPDLVKKLIAENRKVASYSLEGYWLDIGRPEDYERACRDHATRNEG